MSDFERETFRFERFHVSSHANPNDKRLHWGRICTRPLRTAAF